MAVLDLGYFAVSDLSHSLSILVARSAESLYDMVSDVTRIGEWSTVGVNLH